MPRRGPCTASANREAAWMLEIARSPSLDDFLVIMTTVSKPIEDS
jgi:hypothetical protein